MEINISIIIEANGILYDTNLILKLFSQLFQYINYAFNKNKRGVRKPNVSFTLDERPKGQITTTEVIYQRNRKRSSPCIRC